MKKSVKSVEKVVSGVRPWSLLVAEEYPILINVFGSKTSPFRAGIQKGFPIELDQGLKLKIDLTIRQKCGIILLHRGGGLRLSLESATAPIEVGITM